jgi:glycosyltransferase involved in cell wall biosynthesis
MFDFTIITPVYNGETYIRETVESVIENIGLEFTYQYIIVDDGSKDSTFKILEEFNSNKNIEIFSISNNGEANAVNFALNKAKGEYVVIVNADDPLFTKDLFTKSYEILKSNRNIVVTYPDWQVISENNQIMELKKLPDFSVEHLVGEYMCLPGPGAVFRCQTALKIGGRNTEYKFVSDYDFWLRMNLEGDFDHIPEVLAQWREHAFSTSINKRGLSMGLERIQVIDKFIKSTNYSNRLKRKGISHAYYYAALLSYFSNDVPGRKWMLKAFKLRKGWIEKADWRVVLFCLALPMSRYLLPILNKTPLINKPLKK